MKLNSATLSTDMLRTLQERHGDGAWVAVRYDNSIICGDGLGALGAGDTWPQALASLGWSRKVLDEQQQRAEANEGRWAAWLRTLIGNGGSMPGDRASW